MNDQQQIGSRYPKGRFRYGECLFIHGHGDCCFHNLLSAVVSLNKRRLYDERLYDERLYDESAV